MLSQPIFVVLFLGTTGALAQVCYYPDGTVSSGDVPCASSGSTHCCSRHTGICLDNGFCLDAGAQPFGLSRASCTDRNWGSSCPSQCIGANDSPQSGCPLASYKHNSTTTLYCCVGADVASDDAATACQDGAAPFELADATPILGFGALADVQSISSTSTSTASGSATASAAAATSSCAQGSANSTCPASSSHEVAVGAGVGVPLGLIALTAIGWAFWERRRGKQLSRAVNRVAPAPAAETGATYTVPYGNNNGAYVSPESYYNSSQNQFRGQVPEHVELQAYREKVELQGSSSRNTAVAELGGETTSRI